MLITQKDAVFVAEASYEERHALKAAGFWWHGGNCRGNCGGCAARIGRVWWTPKVEVAARLVQFADAGAAQALGGTVTAIEQSRAVDAEIAIPTPEGLAYRGYQRAGVRAALDAFKRDQKGLIIGDEMGLGKTMQAIGVMATLEPALVLVVCPASLRVNWRNEITKWLPDRAVAVLDQETTLPATGIVIVNYERAVGSHARAKALRASLLAVSWDLVVFDEAHMLKNETAKRTKLYFGAYARRGEMVEAGIVQNAKRVLLLTGTPIQNRVRESLTLLRAVGALNPVNGVAKGEGHFLVRFCEGPSKYVPGKGVVRSFDGAKNLDELQSKLRAGWMVRRLKRDVAKELPPKIRTVVTINGDIAARARQVETEAFDLEILAEVVKRAADPDYAFDADVSKLLAQKAPFEAIARVRSRLAALKVEPVVEHVTELLETEGRRVLVFAHHHTLLDALRNAFPASVVIDGRTPVDERQARVEQFQTDESVRVAILGTHAAGVGLTLTRADVVVFAEADWNPSWCVQAEDRAHRIGQTAESVTVNYLVIDGSLDAHVVKTMVRKMDIADRALDTDERGARIEAAIEANGITKGAPAPKPERKSAAITINPKGSKHPVTVTVTDEVRAAAHQAVKILAGTCDGARTKDDVGFDRNDSDFGKSLAHADRLSDKQTAWAVFFCRKYHRQLPEEILAVVRRE